MDQRSGHTGIGVGVGGCDKGSGGLVAGYEDGAVSPVMVVVVEAKTEAADEAARVDGAWLTIFGLLLGLWESR